MPHFSNCCPGTDDYICQVCLHIFCSNCKPSQWRTDITKCTSAGNVCPDCAKKHDDVHKIKPRVRQNTEEMADISLCPICNEEIDTGWGCRVECPHCEKWVTTINISRRVA